MPGISIENLGPDLVEQLKQRAKQNGHSLDAEIKEILNLAAKIQAAPKISMEEALAISKKWHRRLAGRIHGDSADLIRATRDA